MPRLRILAAVPALLVLSAVCPVAQAATLSWPSALQVSSLVQLQSGAVDADLAGVACWSAEACVAVGEAGGSGTEKAIVVPETDGVPRPAVAVTLPANAKTGSGAAAALNSVSCSSDACVAVGNYRDGSGAEDALVVPISAGAVGKGVEVSPPGASGASSLAGVSCPSTGTCLAVGTAGTASNSFQEGFTVPIASGSPGTAVAASLPANASTGSPEVSLGAVSCWLDGSCVAVGQYEATDGSIDPLVISVSGGGPTTGVEATLPGGAIQGGAGQQSLLGSVSCETNGVCAAAGSYVDVNGHSQALLVTINAGIPAAPNLVIPPAGATGSALNDVSCSASGPCSAVGYDIRSDGSTFPLVVPVSDPGAASEVSLPSNALAGFQAASLDAVACPSSVSCLAVGGYDASDSGQGLMVPISNGSPAAATEATAPIGASFNPDAVLEATSCVASGSCVAVGEYGDATAQPQAFEYSLQTPLTVSTSKLAGARVGTAYTATLGESGAWDSYTWSLASGTLPRGLSLNAQTGVIAGKPTAAGTRSFRLQVSGTGSPLQTAAKTFSIAVVKPKPVISLSIGTGGLKLSGKRVSIRVRCSAAAACPGSLKLVYTHAVTLKHHKRKRENTVIGRASYSLTAGRSRAVTVKLTTAGVRFATSAKTHRISISVDATVKTGKPISKRTTIHAAAPKKKKKTKS